MAKFQIHTYMFRPVTEEKTGYLFEEFEKVNPRDSLARKQELTGGILDGENRLRFEYNGVEYAHRMYLNRDGIYVLRIANNGHKPAKVENDFKISKQDNHPSCLVIIDNRKDRQIIAIQDNGKKSAFGKKPSLAGIIEATLRKALEDYRLTLDVKPKFHTSEFWQVVDTHMMIKGIEFVEFPFAYPNLPEISNMVDDFMNEVALRTNSEPTLHLQGQNKESVTLDKEDKWLIDAIKACAASGRPILIKPKGLKVRRIGKQSPVYEDIPDAALTELDQPDLFDSKYEAIVEFLNTIKLVYD